MNRRWVSQGALVALAAVSGCLFPGSADNPCDELFSEGYTRCGSECVSLFDNPYHCGECDHRCPAS